MFPAAMTILVMTTELIVGTIAVLQALCAALYWLTKVMITFHNLRQVCDIIFAKKSKLKAATNSSKVSRL